MGEGAAPLADSTAARCCERRVLEGSIKAASGKLGELAIAHCTLAPLAGMLAIASGNDESTLRIERTICGPVEVQAADAELIVHESILDAQGGQAILVPNGHGLVVRSTIVGSTNCQAFDADSCIFDGKVDIERQQQGCVRFSFVDAESNTPRRHRCQPDLALLVEDVKVADVLIRVVPQPHSAIPIPRMRRSPQPARRRYPAAPRMAAR
jgi:hypothetical protein